METPDERIHTTLNLSRRLIKEAQRLFGNKSRTELIHEALEEMIRRKNLIHHIKKWAGRGKIHSYG